MMTKNLLAVVTLLGVALWSGCATGGGGHTGSDMQVTVSTNPPNQSLVGVTLTVQFQASVTHTDNQTVTWSLTQNGTACTAACGTISASGLYTAPAAPPNPAVVNVTATSVANTTKSDTAQIKVLPITVTVTPGPATVGLGLKQQFVASVTPDAAPQTVTWAISAADCPANDCGTIDTNGLFTAPNVIPAGGTFSVQATSTIDSPNWIGTSDVTVVTSRLNGSYAYFFSGYDSSNKPVSLAGNFVANTDGTIQGGTQDELTAAGHNRCTILSTSRYTLDGNNHGALTLKTTSGACAVNARTYNFVLNAAGDGQMIEFDGVGRGSGRVSQADTSDFSNAKLTGGFAFGFTGTNIISGKRAASAGVFFADGHGNIGSSAGALDINDGGVATSSTNVTGSYNIGSDGSGTLTLVDNNAGGTTYQFAIYVVGGKTQNDANPLTLYAIATDPLANPAVLGTIVFQDKTQTFDKSALNAFSVSNLTGVDNTGSKALVALIDASGDGNGNVSATYDANNAGTIVAAKAFNSTYTATGNGRYTVDLLNPAVHFVLYLSAANRGFLLDSASAQVYSGTMDQQTGSSFAVAEMSGSFEAVTGSTAAPNGSQVAMNLLNTLALPNFAVAGVQDETDGGQNAGQTLAGTGTLLDIGTGTITLTAPAAAKYVIYTLDNPKQSGFLIQHFVMINVDPANTNPTVIFGER